MKLLVLVFTFTLCLSAASAGPRNGKRFIGANPTSIIQLVPLVIVGEGWSQKIIIQSVDETTLVHGLITFQRQDGTDWPVRLRILGSNLAVKEEVDFAFFFDLEPGAIVTFETPVTHTPQELGIAYVSLRDGVGTGRFFAQTVYRKQVDGRPDLMTSMVLSGGATEFLTIPFDNSDWKYPGVGVVAVKLTLGTEGDAIPYSMEIVTTDGTVEKAVSRTAPNLGLDWFSLVHEYPETAQKVGVLRIMVPPSGTVADPITNRLFFSAVSLQFTPNGAFTAITPYEAGDVLDIAGGDQR